ncbi:OmpW/AlkL family protein [Tropicimonas sp. S265A]|uniref:OmpW/AlkL family protein n=1 Tax=Tropicimonas sp. S265A TaxID=3415134 RepID=UPI003C7D3E19
MRRLALCTATCVLLTAPVHAQSAGEWYGGLGVSAVVPSTGEVTFGPVAVELDFDAGLALTLEYMLTDRIGIEGYLSGSDLLGDVDWLPPVLGLTYHFDSVGSLRPFVGAGINYAYISTAGAPFGLVDIDDNFGIALQLGADLALSDRNFLRFSARYVEMDFDVDLIDTGIGTAEIDPVILSVSLMRRF